MDMNDDKQLEPHADSPLDEESINKDSEPVLEEGAEAAPGPSPSPAPVFHFAGFWMRFWAYLLDLLVIAGINGILIKPVFRAFDLPLAGSGIFSAIDILTGLVFYAYFILMTKYFSQTLGKMAFGLKVIPLGGKPLSWGTVLFREGIGRYISATINLLYIIVAFMPKKQGLHDIFAETAVIHEHVKPLKPAYS